MTEEAMRRAVSTANGTIIKSLALHNQAPNEVNRGATELAEEGGERDLPLRGAKGPIITVTEILPMTLITIN